MPERLEMTLPSSPKPEITFAVEINGGLAKVREGNSTRQVSAANDAFPIVGSESMASQMMLVRYWVTPRQAKPIMDLKTE